MYNMHVTGGEGAGYDIVIIGRRNYTSGEYRQIARDWIKQFSRLPFTEEKYKVSNQIIATYFCFLVTPTTRNFIKEWLSLCCDFELLSPAGLGKFDIPTKNLGESFVAHREDQSIFSLLCKKYGVSPHRDISQRGKYPETYKSPFYAYKVPSHPNDKYKPIIFLHKSPRLNFKWFIRYIYHRIKSKYSSF